MIIEDSVINPSHRGGLTQSACIYYQKAGEVMMYIGVYVDDIILAGRTENQLQEIKRDLSMKFDIKDLGKLNYFFGTKVVQDEESQ